MENLEDPPGIEAIIGVMFHETAEQLYSQEPGVHTYDAAVNIFETVLPNYINQIAAAGHNLNIVGETVLNLLHAWVLSDDFFTATPKTVEQKLEGTVGGYPMLGYADRTDWTFGGVTIVDYKTGKRPAAKYAADKENQLIFYSLLLEQMGETPIKGKLVYIKDRSEKTVTFTKENQKTVADYVSRSVDAMVDMYGTDSGWLTNKTVLCNWCGYKPVCPAFRTKK